MKIIRWLLSHTLLILVIVSVIYGYMFWGNLLGKDTPVGKVVAYLSNEFSTVDEFVMATKEKQAKLSQDESFEEPVNVPLTQDQQVANAETVLATPDEVVSDDNIDLTRTVKQQPVTISYSHNQIQITQNSAGIIEKKNKDIAFSVREKGNELLPDIEKITDESVAALAKVAPDEVMATEQGVDEFVSAIIEGQTAQEVSSKPLAAATLTAEPFGSAQQEIDPSEVNSRSELATNQESREQPVHEPLETIAKLVPPAVLVTKEGESTHHVSEQSFVSKEIAARLDGVDERGRVMTDTQRAISVRENWIIARKSFYRGNFQLSEQSYQKVIAASPDNYDAYGELGNVYFNQGKNKQAASAYYEAAAIFVKNGQFNRANSLMGLLQRLDITKARELQKLIHSSMSS
ncbi:MAG: hypothetical protein COB77_04820 [Gammaproteobacteria bacterium]|nr:MAG: hypothetical protein COB77_04820 [Gammaproteobacteria bacterium]